MTDARGKHKQNATPADDGWDRRPTETPPAFEAFRTYLEMGPSRSLAKVARTLGKNKTSIDRWSAKHQWPARVAAYEAHEARERDQARVADSRKQAVHEQRVTRHQQVAQMGVEALGLFPRELLRRVQENPEVVKAMDLGELTQFAGMAARALPRLIQSERLSLGLSTDNHGGHDGGPLEAARRDVEQMTDAELAAFLAGAAAQAAADTTTKEAHDAQ